ncbi:MAG: lipase [Actinophytocola sp.]|uniref:esterase/lipase family protein n=1 Tax=Actinophytocola sp. TaxID=1872138 RepID=UPI001320BFE0|nr:lipase [Actinophytocola sp.]MPZ82577.1 lipase [Actinophytocola sp.]
MREWWIGLSARRRGLVVVVAVVVVLGGVVVGVRVAGDRGDAGAPARDRPGPVLLVPGYGGSRAALSTLADRLRRAGRSAEVLTLPGDGTGDLRAQVRVLDRAAADAVAAGAPSVDVIGYSAGGVVARLWVAGDGAPIARRVVTLGAPLHGSRIATAGGVLVPDACPVACQQLSPGSALLTELDGQPVPLPWLSVWTENDRTVIPPDSARLTDAVNVALQQVCPDAVVEHSQLPVDPLVTGLVLRALGTDPLTSPGAGECARLRAEGAG